MNNSINDARKTLRNMFPEKDKEMTFDEFVDWYKRERANGHIKLTLKGKETTLTMLDLAVTFVIGIFWDAGIKTVTEEDIAIQIPLLCGADIETLGAIEVA